MMAEQTHSYLVEGMDCASCAINIEKGVSKLDGVRGVRVDFTTGKLVIDGQVDIDALQSRVSTLGYKLVLPQSDAESAAPPVPEAPRRGGVLGFWDYLLRGRETRFALMGGALILITLILGTVGLPQVLQEALFIAATGIAGFPIFRSGINTFLINRDFNINLLMTIAAVGAVLIGETLEAATVVFLFAVGEALEGYTADRARDSLRSLMRLAPSSALRLTDAGEEVVSVGALRVDDRILVKPGERIPMDGVVLAGESGVDQATITGESMPVQKAPGAEVFAGTINGSGALTVRVTHLAADNTLSRIIRLVEEAQSVRAPSQRLVDQFARWYTPAVVVVAVIVALVPPLLFNAPFLDTPDAHGWLYRALSLLVIACPCALVISAPVTVISAITRAARGGVLIKGGAHLEALGGIRAFAFDKTGTLTHGQPVVLENRSIDCERIDAPCPACDDMLALASALESRSTHPLARAVVNAAESRGVDHAYPPAESVEMLAGRGIRGRVGTHEVTVGSHSLFDERYPHPEALCAAVNQLEAQGSTTMLLSDGQRVRGYIAVADAVREDSKAVIAQLKSLGGVTAMLTGDNPSVAANIAAQVGVDDVRASLLPADKVDAVQGLMAQHGTVAMIGDGVNDTPALAAATVGIAMGGAGSAQALETADIALMADDLKQLPFAVRLSRFARGLIRQNVVLSLGIKLLFMALAIEGTGSLWGAIMADVGMSLVVTLNGMRPLRFEV